jgi:hypothetical protein
MNERQPYTYVLLRYRHDPLAGEFANVGVLVHAPKGGFLRAAVRPRAGPRLHRMFPGMSRPDFHAAMHSIERSIEALADQDGGDLLSSLGDASAFARRALPADDSSFFWGPVGSGLTADPERTLARLYARFVTQYDAAAAGQALDDTAVWRPVQDLLAARRIADRLQPKVIRSSVGSVAFEHAWKNGAWHVYQPVSFDLASDDHIQAKAVKWAGNLLILRDAEEPFETHFIVGAPRDTRLGDAYRRALDALRLPRPDAEIVDEGAIEGLVDRLASELRAHDAAVAS